MIGFEFDKYTKNLVDADTLSSKYLSKKKLVLEELSKSTMTGWMREISQTLIEEILKVRDEIKSRASLSCDWDRGIFSRQLCFKSNIQ